MKNSMITDIIIHGIKEKCFLFENKTLPSSIKTIDLKISDKVDFSSIVKTDENKNLFIKITPSKYGNKNKKLRFILREIIAERLCLNVKTIREFRSTKKLRKIGINTPEVYSAGFFLTNKSKYSGIIIYKMLNNQVTAKEYMLSSESNENKAALLDRMTNDYKKMSKKGIHFYDYHLSNVLVNTKTLDIYWIDPILKNISYF
jgi:tRNA A-37 threonylcarbamoyl transferase component Bud32